MATLLMGPSRHTQYLEEYQQTLLQLKSVQVEDEESPQPVEIIVELRRSLSEIFAVARRSLSEKESRLFKIACEEIEDCLLLN